MRVLVNVVLALGLCLTACAQAPLPVTPSPPVVEPPSPAVVPDRYCYKTDDGYWLFLGPDAEIGISQKSCSDAVLVWNHTFTSYPRRYTL